MDKPLLAGIVVVAYAACGAGDSLRPHRLSSACQSIGATTVQLFGDSTMAGYEGGRVAGSVAAHSPRVALQSAMDARFGAGTVVVVDRSVSGTTAAQLLAGTDGRNERWPRSVDADIVVINHGINDMQGRKNEGLEEYRAILESFAADSGRAALVFETPNIVKYWTPDTAPYAQKMREVATEYGIPIADTYGYTASLPDWQQLIPDWAHPSDTLYQRIVANSLAPVVAAQVARLRCAQS